MANASVNMTILLGNLGSDPELRYTSDGKPRCLFSLATHESFSDGKGGYNTQTEWHRIVVWGKTAGAAAKFLTKGRQVYIEGRNHTRQWEDKDKIKHYVTEVHAKRLQFLGTRPQEAAAQQAIGEEEIPPMDLPTNNQPQQQELALEQVY